VLLDDFPPWFLRVFALAFGLIWGSFLNVVIYRVPRGMSVVRPGSTCPACGKPIRAWHNIPLFGYLFLRGKASCCGAKVSPRYPLVEAIGGVLAIAILEAVVFRLGPTTTIERGLAVFVADLALALALASSRLETALPADAAACGEIGLGGEVRRVARLDARVAEAARLGFRRLLVPAGARDALAAPPGTRLFPVADVAEAVGWLRSTGVHAGEPGR
jgi:leader peptidase (prepilin peptidase)/N-methyltransferase